MSEDVRLQQLHQWLLDKLNINDYQLKSASGDASFRRYFRLSHDGHSYIVMDAPPEKEDCRPFVALSAALINIGLNAPQVIEQDLEQGYLLLTDLGAHAYLDILTADNVDSLYGDAMDALLTLQASGAGLYDYPPYDKALLLTEMELFREWLLVKHLHVELSAKENKILDDCFGLLAESALEQPQVPVHRDYHSRNLMRVGEHNPGILDFQDAVMGPVTYDLVSLLRDCYIQWPREQVEAWALGYHQQAVEAGILPEENKKQFLRWFDLMGVQRHLKAAGIFARLNHRDGKPGYLQDIPRTVGYIKEVCVGYPELEGVCDFLGKVSF